MMPGAKPRKPTGKSARTERVSQFTTPVDDETMAFIQAIERFKSDHGRSFPTWTDVLKVLKELGYERKTPVQPPRS
jgi:hypothetical protein